MLGLTIGRVQGQSMLPRLLPDSFVLCVWLPWFIPKKIGAMYYIQHPQYGAIVKTLAVVHANGNLEFRGESNYSTTQQALGQLHHRHIIGRVLWVFAPK